MISLPGKENATLSICDWAKTGTGENSSLSFFMLLGFCEEAASFIGPTNKLFA